MTRNSTIEQSKQLPTIADVYYDGVRFSAGSLEVARTIEGRRISEWLRIIRARARECAGRRAVAAEARVIGVGGVNICRIRTADRDRDSVENRDRISRQNLGAVAAQRNVGSKIKLSVAARSVKFQRCIS